MGGAYQLAVLLFLQLTIVLVTCRIVGRLLRFAGQTQVVSEMVAGVLLGPSLFGLLAPNVQQALFPKTHQVMVGGVAQSAIHPSMAILYAISQIGLVLYMFLIGLQLDTNLLRKHSRAAAFVSLSGILAPVVMGALLGTALIRDDRLFSPQIEAWQAALFTASAMSITAFPMLARILTESGIAATRTGTLAISAAAFDDAAAWCLLACVIATVNDQPSVALLAIGGGALYALVMAYAGRPIFQIFARDVEAHGQLRSGTMGLLMAILAACAYVTDAVGIYSVFGAFIAGLAMPRGRFANEVVKVVEPLTVNLLLPVFFVYSGLNTRMDLLVEPALLGLAALTIVVAFVCKGGGCLIAAKMTGISWRDASIIGVLMNARGLMELILVNIALERGLIRAEMFTILVLMAVVTTLAASPLYRFLAKGPAAMAPDAVPEEGV